MSEWEQIEQDDAWTIRASVKQDRPSDDTRRAAYQALDRLLDALHAANARAAWWQKKAADADDAWKGANARADEAEREEARLRPVVTLLGRVSRNLSGHGAGSSSPISVTPPSPPRTPSMAKRPDNTHPVESGAQSLLYRLAEQTEDVMDEVSAELWPLGEEDWWSGVDSPAATAHSERVYASVIHRLSQLLKAAADAADERANRGPRPVETNRSKISLTPEDTK